MSSTTYNASLTSLQSRYGDLNILAWSDTAGSTTLNSTNVAAALQYAVGLIHLHLQSGPYTLPLVALDEGATALLQSWVEVLAVDWLCVNRASLPSVIADRLLAAKDEVLRMLKLLKEGRLRINCTQEEGALKGPCAV